MMLERHPQVVAVLSGSDDGNSISPLNTAIHVRSATAARPTATYRQVTVYPTHLEITTHQLTPGAGGQALGANDDLYCEVPM